MSSRNSAQRLLGTSSVLALSVGAVLATAMIQPAAAAGVPASGLWGGGGSLSSLTIRQITDCYHGAEVAGDHYATSPSFTSNPPTPGTLPAACATATSNSLEGLYGAVGSGRGQQAFIAHDPLQLVNGGPSNITATTVVYPTTVSTPATLPSFIDVGNADTNFSVYPYPGLTFAAGDNPLPSTLTTNVFTFSASPTTNWATATSPAANITVDGFATGVSYDSTKFGPAVQFPLFEVPVSIAVNTTGLSGLQSAGATPTNAGGAIQLSTAQVCAIFSGTVTDWSSSASIAALDNTGAVTSQLFYADNVSTTAASTAQPYATSSTPIHVTYRSDGSGTSYIFTNYLKANCAALDNGSNHYAAIFGSTAPNALPSTSFSNLVNNVTAAGNSVAAWQSGNGSSGVAKAIATGSTAPATPGAIGYLSADFTTPYANSTVIAGAPNSASVQNENQRESGVYHPANGTSFIAPTPTNVHTAFNAFGANVTVPTASTNYTNWDLYGYTYTATSTITTAPAHFLNGKSILGIPSTANAYPVAGTTYLYTYSCYANVNSASGNPPVVDLLAWYYNNGGSSPNATVEAVLENNGFHGFNAAVGPTRKQNLAAVLFNTYLSQTATTSISKAGSTSLNTACQSASGA